MPTTPAPVITPTRILGLGLSPTVYRRMVQAPDQAIEALRQRRAAWMIEVR